MLRLDPQTETPALLHQYAKAKGVRPGWTFLMTKPQDLELTRRRLSIFDPNPMFDADKTQLGALVTTAVPAKPRISGTFIIQ